VSKPSCAGEIGRGEGWIEGLDGVYPTLGQFLAMSPRIADGNRDVSKVKVGDGVLLPSVAPRAGVMSFRRPT
jgi:hypothetical protein